MAWTGVLLLAAAIGLGLYLKSKTGTGSMPPSPFSRSIIARPHEDAITTEASLVSRRNVKDS
jgi:hypothetical protein